MIRSLSLSVWKIANEKMRCVQLSHKCLPYEECQRFPPAARKKISSTWKMSCVRYSFIYFDKKIAFHSVWQGFFLRLRWFCRPRIEHMRWGISHSIQIQVYHVQPFFVNFHFSILCRFFASFHFDFVKNICSCDTTLVSTLFLANSVFVFFRCRSMNARIYHSLSSWQHLNVQNFKHNYFFMYRLERRFFASALRCTRWRCFGGFGRWISLFSFSCKQIRRLMQNSTQWQINNLFNRFLVVLLNFDELKMQSKFQKMHSRHSRSFRATLITFCKMVWSNGSE